MLIRVFYVSEIADFVTDVDVQVILGVAQVHNRRRDIAGMLAQSDGHFAQVLEGRVDAVRELVASIVQDRRHRAFRLLLDEPIVRRQFPNWAMRLVRRDDMAEPMRCAHRDGCRDEAEAEALIRTLMAAED